MKPTISFIIPTKGRLTLRNLIATLRSEIGPKDEVLVIGDGAVPLARGAMSFADTRFHYWEYGPTGNWGNSQRDFGIYHATGDFLMFADDDDNYLPGAINGPVRSALAQAPDRPHCFRRLNGTIGGLGPPVPESWRGTWSVGGALFVPPNVPGKLGTWNGSALAQEQDAYFILGTLQHYRAVGVMGHDIVLYHVRPHAPQSQYTIAGEEDETQTG